MLAAEKSRKPLVDISVVRLDGGMKRRIAVLESYRGGQTMQATVGDRLVVKSHHVGEPERDGRIMEVQGVNGEPPYLVEWSFDGHVGLVFPGSDAVVEHFSRDHKVRPAG